MVDYLLWAWLVFGALFAVVGVTVTWSDGGWQAIRPMHMLLAYLFWPISILVVAAYVIMTERRGRSHGRRDGTR